MRISDVLRVKGAHVVTDIGGSVVSAAVPHETQARFRQSQRGQRRCGIASLLLCHCGIAELN